MANKGSFKRGDSRAGRRRGSLNKKTVAIQDLARRLTTENPEYIASLERRIREGTLPPAIENTLLWYGHGKPKETVELHGDAAHPLQTIMRVIVDPKADA